MATALRTESNTPASGTSRTGRAVTRYLPVVVRVLMGAMFFLGGLFGLLMHPQAPPGLPAGAIAFNQALSQSGYMLPMVCLTQAIGGALLLSNRFVPLALALLAPVVVNIFAFHLFLEPSGRPVSVVLAVATIYLAWQYRAAYRGMLAARAPRAGVDAPARSAA